MKVVVVNRKNPGAPRAYRVLCFRPHPYGNPYVMKNEGERAMVCDLFDVRFRREYDTLWRTSVLRHLAEAYDRGCDTVEIVCCCAPKRCHGDTVAAKFREEISAIEFQD